VPMILRSRGGQPTRADTLPASYGAVRKPASRERDRPRNAGPLPRLYSWEDPLM